MRLFLFILLACTALHIHSAAAGEFDHGEWNRLLGQHVVLLQGGQASQVDYAGFAADRSSLQAYLNALSAVSRERFDQWPPHDQLAFLINAYNAWTVELILTAWPDITSIKETGSVFRSPWKKSFIPLLGETRSLDDIEHGLIRGSGRHNDPRVHFAVNCASVGCPALREEAYTGNRLEAQLESQAIRFLSDPSRNVFEGGALKLSSIFKWYRKDFEKGRAGVSSLSGFLAYYSDALGLDGKETERLKADSIDIEFLDYDWRLNALRQGA